MSKAAIAAFGLCLLSALTPNVCAQNMSAVVVFREEGFPAADSINPSPAQLEQLFSGAHLASAQELPSQLASTSSRLLVLPYGSAFPEDAWPGIRQRAFHSAPDDRPISEHSRF